MGITHGLGFCFLRSLCWFPPLSSLGVMASCYPETRVGGNGASEGAGCARSTRLMAALLPVRPRPLTSLRGSVSRQHAGSCEVQCWGFLSPLGFTHPLPIKSVSPPRLFFLCVRVCVLIIQWLLACFPNPTWTFLSATEKRGIPSTGKQSERPGRIPALCTNPSGHGPCPIAKEEDERTLRSMCEQKAPRSYVVHSHLWPILQTRVPCPRGLQPLAQVTQVQSKQNDSVFQNGYHKAFSSLGTILHKKHSHTQRLSTGKGVLQLTSHGNFLITKH